MVKYECPKCFKCFDRKSSYDYHMNKKYWNTVLLDGSVPEILVWQLIDHSYELIRGSAQKQKPKSKKKSIVKRRK